jgi:hypothetical protein
VLIGWAEDPGLGAWVNNQRAWKRKLDRGKPSGGMTAERAARLTALGFVWDSLFACSDLGPAGLCPRDAAWEAQLARLAAYKADHGDCSVPGGWAKNPQLATWVQNQRRRKRKLERGEPSPGITAERVARLTALGLVWDLPTTNRPKEAEWEAQLARLVAYKAEHGHCNVLQPCAEDPRLGRWVAAQRVGKRKLDHNEPASDGMSAERAARLTALGFTWDLRHVAAVPPVETTLPRVEANQSRAAAPSIATANAPSASASRAPEKRPRLMPTAPAEPAEPVGRRFLDSFAELCECRNVEVEGLHLGQWYRAAVTGADGDGVHLVYLDSQDTEVLESADFERGSWRVHGHHGGSQASEGTRSLHSSSEESEKDGESDTGRSGLYQPVVVVEAGARGSTGGGWNGTGDAIWAAQLVRLEAYKVVHGDCSVPQRWAEDPRLGRWVDTQRRFKRKLDRGEPSQMTAARLARLTALGFAWDPPPSRGGKPKVAK